MKVSKVIGKTFACGSLEDMDLLGLSSAGIQASTRQLLQHGDHLVTHRLGVEESVSTLLVVDPRDAVAVRRV